MTGPAPLVFLDTETTSTVTPWLPHGRRVWDLGMIVRSPDGHEETAQWYVWDVDLAHADPYALDVGRFYDRHPRALGSLHENDTTPAYVATEAEVAYRVFRAIPRGAHVVGAVPGFDVESLAEMAHRHRLPWSAHYHLVDVEALAIGYLGALAQERPMLAGERHGMRALFAPPWKSDDLSRACGVEPSPPGEKHTALGDARWAMRLYDAITGRRTDPAPQTAPGGVALPAATHRQPA